MTFFVIALWKFSFANFIFIKQEPAKYEFSYQVDDSPSGLSFGHSEMRDGDFTTGQYNVLLPDGRKQVRKFYEKKITAEYSLKDKKL